MLRRLYTGFSASIALCGAAGCQSPRIALKTTPEAASVSLLNQQTGAYERVGSTPFSIEEGAALSSATQKSDLLALLLEKDGYVTEHYILDLSARPQIDLVAQLKPLSNLAGAFDAQISRSVEDIGRKIQSIYRQVSAENLPQAYAESAKLTDAYPHSPLSWDIRGSIEMLMNKASMAAKSYKTSLSLNPDNLETKEALSKIERGGR